MLQTALSNAQHRALMALVHAYAGFQIHNGQFYVVESRVAPYISITFRTFSNYLTDLKDLGLLEMVWRCPNQYGEKSVWRMKLEVVLSSGQLAMELPVEEMSETQKVGDEATQSEVAQPEAVQSPENDKASNANEAKPPSASEARGKAGAAVRRTGTWNLLEKTQDTKTIRREIANMSDEEIQEHIAYNEGGAFLFADELQRRGTAVAAPGLTRAERRRLKAEQKRANTRGDVRAAEKEVEARAARESSLLAQDVDALLRESFDMPPLSDAEALRVASLEQEWRDAHSGANAPRDFVEYAATEATLHADH